VRLTPSPVQQDIAESTAEYLAKEFSISRVRDAALADRESVIDDQTWRRWAELGFLSLGLPDSVGGLGLGLVEEFLVVDQLGRHLTPGPTVSSIVAAHVAHEAGDDELSSAICAGDARVGLRVGAIGYDVEVGRLALSVTRSGAELSPVVEASALKSIDPATRVSRITVGDIVARAAGDSMQLRLWVLQSAMLTGVAEAALEQSTAYAKIRHQFGQPIGAFQAVKHRCADMAVRCYVSSAQLHLAAVAVEERWADARFQSAAALTLALDAARTNVKVNVQNHGGIGFTDEHDAGLIVKRATTLAAAVGAEADRLDAMTAPNLSIPR